MSILVDERLGVITSLRIQERAPDMPMSWIAYGANVSRTSEFDVEADRYGFGASFGAPEAARGAALGEAIERYCGNVVPKDLCRASHRDLEAAGMNAVDPASLALFSDEQYTTPGFPFVPFTPELEIDWVDGFELATGSSVYMPASLVYLDTRRFRDPATNPLSYSGIATGRSEEEASRAALEEVVERDATALWWASGAPAVVVEDVEVVTDLAEGLPVRILAIPSELGIPVMAAFIEDSEAEAIAFGTACRADPIAAATKALAEAVGLLQVTKQLLDPSSPLWRAVEQGTVDRHTYLPFRADRRYLDSVSPEYRELIDLPMVAQLYLDPRMQGRPLDRLRATDASVRLGDIPAIDPGEYLSRLDGIGMRAIAVDVTTKDVALAGLTVIRVVIPGMYGNAPAAYPYLGGHRMPRKIAVHHPIPLA